ncbi:phosphoketolase [Candidatus Saccharibacteria bacterium HGW-Saccharibacteria-1]|jgi:xylulose-5-phosphate/fructose-6-phosphate phosphoketolase|nr:MAG: phosphoketolase [Candidatus Saccharibacteria bacterium HGW-Saccharibacteria-1]
MNNKTTDFDKFRRATNYLTAAQIFLQDNFLLERPLTHDDIKPRLLGHWGSGPGVNLIYAHLNNLIKKYGQEMMFILGPGHAFPALQANLFIEGTLTEFYPEASQDYKGISHICRNFSWPYGFPSHSNPGTPGVILEGGELGYSLSTAYGAALDNPNMIVACLVGDGEAETGPAAAAWHLNKLVDPKTNGTVLPILHLNGYKISAPTIFGRMSDQELTALFWGYGYEPRIVSGENLDDQMEETLDWAHKLIWSIKESPEEIVSPRMPMIIMRTEKGWTGVKELDGNKIEGNCLSHQVVLTEAKTDPEQLRLLEEWLSAYKFSELFDAETGFGDFAKNIVPIREQRMGMSPHAHGGDTVYKPLNLPSINEFAQDASQPGVNGSSSMIQTGKYLNEVFKLNKDNKNFRFMSPDETYSNKLDAIFQETSRAWVWPNEKWDKDMAHDGRVMEMLSEHNLQGLAQGYILTGRHAVFASYEAFVQVVVSMMDQYAKFIKHTAEYEWRGDFPSLNYILTSSGWRQDHNGFSHQNPGFIDDALRRHGDFVDVYFPADVNSTLVTMEKMLSSKRQINVVVAGKTIEPQWLTPELARKQINTGIMTWDFASDENPDVVLAGIGDYPTKEVLAAIDLAKNEWPDIRLRFVNVSSLTSRGFGQGQGFINADEFNEIFTYDKPVICNFHGYPETLKAILFNYVNDASRFDIRGYIECGSTTTPFDMHVRNETSRHHLVIAIFENMAEQGLMPSEEARRIITEYQQKIIDNTEYIKKFGNDIAEIDAWQWNR